MKSPKSEDREPTILDLYPELENKASASPADRPKWTDIAIVVLTLGIVLFALLDYLSTRDAGHQTDRIIAAEERLATAMEKSVGEAEKALKATVEQNRSDQRAWVGVEAIGGFPEVSHPYEITVFFKNTGRTPALNTAFIAQQEPVEKGHLPSFKYRMSPVSRGVTEPEASYHLVLPASSRELTQADLDSLRTGGTTVYVFGELTYDDVFRRHHRLTFCSYLRADLKGYDICDRHNGIDPGDENGQGK